MDTLSQGKVNGWSSRCYGKGIWKTWYKGHAAKGRLQKTEEGHHQSEQGWMAGLIDVMAKASGNVDTKGML